MLTLPSDQDASGRTLGDEEIAALTAVIRSGVLTSTKGEAVKQLERKFAALLGVRFAYACSSGSAAVHTALAALDLEPGDEVITTSVTDMGALTPILYQGAIPVFADVDPLTFNVTAESIKAVFSSRTRAVIVTHLFGNPCEMSAIQHLATERGVPVIEDCAQAFLATEAGRMVGSIGAIGAFSIQQGKHITAGEGGLVATNDEALARRCFLFINKAWGYGDPQPDHYFAALNYRMNEITGAVALAQLDKLAGSVASRRQRAAELSEQLAGIPGITLPHVQPGAVHTYWKYCLRVDPKVVAGGAPALGAKLKERGIASAPRYIQKPAFQCAVFREQRTFGKSRWPFTLARPEAVDYSPARFPGTFDTLEHILVLPWNERYEPRHVAYIAQALRDAVAALSGGAR
jgi:dTDP-4-amino-4,6-dideoxygalactose transaminase